MSAAGNRAPILAALGLAWVAGGIDAIGYTSLQHIFTANMTGNTVLLGMALADADWPIALRHAAAIGVYLVGAMIGTVLTEAADRRRDYAIPFVVEAGLLLLFWAYVHRLGRSPAELAAAWTGHGFGLLALLCLATGIQTMAMPVLRGGPALRTTFLTGVLSTLAREIVRWLRGAPAQRSPHSAPPLGTALASTFAGYLLGAICGLVALQRLGWNAVLLLVGALALIAALGRRAFEG